MSEAPGSEERSLSEKDQNMAQGFARIDKNLGREVDYNLMNAEAARQIGNEEAARRYEEVAEDPGPNFRIRMDANSWQAHQHVNENIPEYKQTAAEEMKAETGQDFETNAIDSPGFVQPELSTGQIR